MYDFSFRVFCAEKINNKAKQLMNKISISINCKNNIFTLAILSLYLLGSRLVPSLESEEADWNGGSSEGVELDLKPMLVESTDVFVLHPFMKSHS